MFERCFNRGWDIPRELKNLLSFDKDGLMRYNKYIKIVQILVILILLIINSNFSFAITGSESLNESAEKIAENLKDKLPLDSKVLILDFEDLNGYIPPFGKYLPDKISIFLASVEKNITVVVGEARDLVLKEQQFQISGYVDQQTRGKISSLTGTSHIIQGTIVEQTRTVEVDLRIIDVEKGTLVGGLLYSIPKNQEVTKLLKEGKQPETSKKRLERPKKITKEKTRGFMGLERNGPIFGIGIGYKYLTDCNGLYAKVMFMGSFEEDQNYGIELQFIKFIHEYGPVMAIASIYYIFRQDNIAFPLASLGIGISNLEEYSTLVFNAGLGMGVILSRNLLVAVKPEFLRHTFGVSIVINADLVFIF